MLAMAAVGGIAVAVVGWLRPHPPPGIDDPNVVIVIGCTVRQDQTTPYGGPAETTPFLQTLADDGARFADALSVSSWTRESVAGLLTGTPPASVGLPDPGMGESSRVLVDVATTYPERLRDAGWHTIGITANPNLNVEFGMAQGFLRYEGAAAKGFAKKSRHHGSEVVEGALAMLDARTEEERGPPFLLQLVLIDPHTPRDAKPTEIARFQDATVPDGVPEYRALLRRLDDAIALLDRELRERGYGPHNTLLVFVSDHGEGLSMPKHHFPGHGKRMYPSTVAIPWIVRGPGVRPGAVVEGLASGEDFAPTLYGLLGLPPDPAAVGRDWSRLLRAGGRTDRDRAYALSMFHGADVASIWTDRHQCQLDLGSRGSDPPLVEGCFDRVTDLQFAVPGDRPALLDDLRAWRTARLQEGARHAVRDATPPDATREQLEVLGYVE